MKCNRLITMCLLVVIAGGMLGCNQSIAKRSPRGLYGRHLFDSNWKFTTGDYPAASKVDFDDSQWRKLNLPHDWSIEGASLPKANKNASAISAIAGMWRFHKGDKKQWKQADFDDSQWEKVKLPGTWEKLCNYNIDPAYGWFRRNITIPASLRGKDITLLMGKIDDADETYFNGVKIGATGKFPPNYKSAWEVQRRYHVPAKLINYGGRNVIAVRVYDDSGPGGIYASATAGKTEGPFDADSPAGRGGGYLDGGIGWYRKEFNLPEKLESESGHVFIDFDGVYMDSDVWLNGHHLGNHPYGYTSFQYELTPWLKYGRGTDNKNVLAVRVNVKQPCSRWYSGAGIYRNVWLRVEHPVHFSHWGTYITTENVKVADKSATIHLRCEITNQSDKPAKVYFAARVLDKNGLAKTAYPLQTIVVPANGTYKIDQKRQVTNIQLWSPEKPYLYKVVTNLAKAKSGINPWDNPLDTQSTNIGIRRFKFTYDKGFFLNGKHTRIKGVCMHHDLGCLGSAVNYYAIKRQLTILKSFGCNAIRTSHNPPAPELLDLCDKMGFLVMDEAFDEWKIPKRPYGYGRFFDDWSKRDLTSMIRRDRNHPSIILYSIGNEIPEQGSKNGYKMSKRLVDICHSEDPTRPVTSACSNPAGALKTGFAKPLDVMGINYNIWAYKKNKGKFKLVASETSSDFSSRGVYNLIEDKTGKLVIKKNYNNQCTSYDISYPGWGHSAETSLKALKASPWIAGEFVWTGFDYIGEPTPFGWPSRSSYFGIVDLCGFAKDRYYLYQSQWTEKPMVHILPHWNWQQYAGKEIPVWCYSNCDAVELFLNGKSLGKKSFADTKDLHLAWQVPYTPGTLKAVAWKNGQKVCTDVVRTAGEPARLRLKADKNILNSSQKDMAFIKVQIVDKNGVLCPNACNMIHFDISGAGAIAGMGNGDATNHEFFQGNKHLAFQGLCLVVVKNKHKKGTIRLTASAKGLEPATVTLISK